MKALTRVFAAIFLLLMSVSYSPAADIEVTWIPPTTNEDGTPLTDLAGYQVYFGTSSGAYAVSVNVGNVTSHVFTELPEGRFYFVATAVDTSGNESRFSNESVRTVVIPPANPTGCATRQIR